jgi:hypothetical protein
LLTLPGKEAHMTTGTFDGEQFKATTKQQRDQAAEASS